MAIADPSPVVSDRKADHLAIVAGEGVLHGTGTGLEAIRLRHRALPGRDLADVDLGVELLGRTLAAPLLVSAMTGGTAEAVEVNDRLAHAAACHGVAMSLGSAGPLIGDPSLLRSYRPAARPPLLLANLGAAGLEPETAARAVELLRADALSLHLNPLQEAIQPEGRTCFADARDRIAATVAALAPIPVVVKEVGFGLDTEDVRQLVEAGVAAIDVAGAGGTNWALVEGRRATAATSVAAAFADWGRPTAAAVRDAVANSDGVPVIASGGLVDGVDVAKGLALGAHAAGIARPLLLAARADHAGEAIDTIIQQLRIATWLTGAPGAGALSEQHVRSG